MNNPLLKKAALHQPANTKRGALERLFAMMFQGFVYNQIWEDPKVDMAALDLKTRHKIVAIASGGCNVLNYLTADPEKILAVDLNPNHVALTRLKLAALAELPSHEDFFRFFGQANDVANRRTYDRYLAGKLDSETRSYWEKRIFLRGRRINMFARNLYRYGLLGRFIGLLHVVARMHGKSLEHMLEARTLAEQRATYERLIAPLFDNATVRLLSRSPVSLYALGIPPAQYDDLVSASGGDPISVLRERVKRLACDFPMSENYFAWQAFGRGYDVVKRRAIPAYLRREVYDVIRHRTGKVEVHNASLTDFLACQPAGSLHRFVLLDAQDWMTPDQLAALWTEIGRTADPTDGRVIFRTAGAVSPLSHKLPKALLENWAYREAESRAFHAQDRSSIYGGFHVYIRKAGS
jgi:S-adenosylmethionine-diacylglycerol 3-amino-3-carboxypropyl transferase